MKIIRLILILTITSSGFFSLQAASLNEAMQDCAEIKRDLKRLACFDQLSGRATSFVAEEMTEAQTQQVQKVNTETKAVLVTTPKTPESDFGLDTKTKAEEINIITSTIEGEFSGWRKDDEIMLANGQVWKITSGSLFHKATNPKIEIKRGVFGSYRIKVIGLNKTAQVKRIK
ncbi:MAG: hypothetical protein KJO69_07630 [Gammaproteobacteria bacterium]|nr:hypothetical protein [Gammaproteobacteria bacterium]NNJ71944.1 hypothetical protein [Enterobacterales bacterium]